MQRLTLPRVLVTGSSGLIGSALCTALRAAGYEPRSLDLRAPGEGRGDVRDRAAIDRAIEGCGGVVHLAAVSRVIDGERDPAACWAINVEGTRNVIEAALAQAHRPWLVYASSREVYGQPQVLPASEDAPRAPVNIYGRSKVAAEDLTAACALRTAIVRFSNVYGSTSDHADRVVPAFARRAGQGLALRVDGSGNTFDFTHIADTVRALMALVSRLERGDGLPPMHFLTGQPTSLGELAAMAVELAGSSSPVHEAAARTFDVHGFHGDPGRAAEVLGWRAEVTIREGLGRLIRDFRERDEASHPA